MWIYLIQPNNTLKNIEIVNLGFFYFTTILKNLMYMGRRREDGAFQLAREETRVDFVEDVNNSNGSKHLMSTHHMPVTVLRARISLIKIPSCSLSP